jgi:hypothetical protein
MAIPSSLRWCAHKCDIPQATTPEPFLVSRDVNASGAKEFYRFDTLADAVAYLTSRQKGAYNEVLEHHDLACKLYFDLDRPDTTYSSETVAMHMLAALGEYLHKIFDFDFAAIPGTNCQISQASTATKTSVHLCCHVRVASVIGHRGIAKSLIKFVTDSADRWPALVTRAGDKIDCVIDDAVYSQFRSFRMLGMVKHGRNNALAPMMGSSGDLVDHIIGYYASQHADIPELPAPMDGSGPLLQMCGTHARKDGRPPNKILPASAFVEFEDVLNRWTSVRTAFPVGEDGLRVAAVTETAYEYRLRIDKRQNIPCVYAKRVHANQKLYLNLSKDRRSAEVICHDSECVAIMEQQGTTILYDNDWGSNALYDGSGARVGGLHAQSDNIDWDEDYNAPKMRDLPVGPIVCVLAGMGIGKTVAIKAVLKKSCKKKTKALVVTHSRSLAAKLYEDFKDLGFVNYQNSSGPINDAKIVVCLDSLYRVVTGYFDILVVDEAVAVFLHFNSSHMNQRAKNSWLMESLITQAKSTYLVDAGLDATFMKNIVDHFSAIKSITPIWIRNRHVRPSNRRATITVCDGPLGGIIGEGSLVYAAATKVLELLQDGKKVACCSSTKKFTEILDEFIAERRPETRVKVYNAGTGSADLRHVDQEWVKYDLLVYSPSISSGVSFVAEHFDCVVGYLVNSQFTPGVETGLQQLFRVRQLRDGDMFLFVHNARPGVVLPCETEEIDALLTEDLVLASKHFVTNQLTFEAQVRFDTDHFEYDKSRMSWHIICGIIQTQNQSAMYFTDVLAGALTTDYAIPVKRVGVQSAIGSRDLDLAILQNAAKTRAIPPFETIVRLASDQYDELKASTVELTLEERAALRLYDCEHGIWGVAPELVDDEFYRTLVMAAGAFDYYFHVKRFMSLAQSLNENTARMRDRMREIIGLSDKNLELFKTKSRMHYTLLLTGQSLLQCVLSGTQIDQLVAYDHVLVPIERVEREVSRYLKDLSAEENKAFMTLFKLTPGTAGLKIVQAVAKAAFGVSVARQHGHPEKKAYNVIKFKNDKLQKVVAKYLPSFPAMG